MMKKVCFFLILMLATSFATEQMSEKHHSRRSRHHSDKDDNKQQWTYNHGGSEWGHQWRTCKLQYQSPINIPPATLSYDTKLKIHWKDAVTSAMTYEDFTYQMAGHFCTISVVDVEKKELTYHAYKLEIHEPSEHYIRNKQFDIQVQIYLQIDSNDAGKTNKQTAVLALLYQVNKLAQNNPFFQKYDVVLKANNQLTINPQTDFEPFFAPSYDYYTFIGSLTKPPCQGEINWFVIDKEFHISGPQYQKIAKQFSQNRDFAPGNQGNNRELQEKAGRMLKRSTTHTRMNLLQKQITVHHNDQKLRKSSKNHHKNKKN